MSAANIPNRGQKRPLAHARTEPNLDESPTAKKPKPNSYQTSGAVSESQIGQPSRQDETPFASTLEEMDKMYLKPEQGKKGWPRPQLANLDPQKDPIKFQQICMEDASDPATGELVIRVYGATKQGNSVMAIVTGVLPHFYVAMPPNFTNEDIADLQDYLNAGDDEGSVYSIEKVFRRSLGLVGQEEDRSGELAFLKITLLDLNSFTHIRDELLSLHFKSGRCQFRGFSPGVCETYGSDLPDDLRFMIEKKVVGMNWIEVSAGKYSIIPDQSKLSTCQLEITFEQCHLISHKPEGEWSQFAPLRILSFDLECAVRGTNQPKAYIDPVYQIANMVLQLGEEHPFIRNVFALSSCDPITGAQVLTFQDEKTMFRDWQEFIRIVDPDIIVGYNNAGFDVPYLIERANSHALRLVEFPCLGRMKGLKAEVKETTYTSKGYTPRDSNHAELQGRLQFDLMRVMHREYDFKGTVGYKLNDVSHHFLKQRKEDIHFTQITPLQNGTSATRRRLALYCLKDTYLPLRLLMHPHNLDSRSGFSLIVEYINRARESGVPFNFLVATKNQEPTKVLFELYQQASKRGYLVLDGQSSWKHRQSLVRLSSLP